MRAGAVNSPRKASAKASINEGKSKRSSMFVALISCMAALDWREDQGEACRARATSTNRRNVRVSRPPAIDFGAALTRGAAKPALAEPYSRAADHGADDQRQQQDKKERRRYRESGNVVRYERIERDADDLPIGESKDQQQNSDGRQNDEFGDFQHRETASAIDALVEPFAHFLAGLEEGHNLLDDRDLIAGARVAAGSGGALLGRKCAEAAQFNPFPARQSRSDLVKDGVDNIFDVALVKMRIARRHPLHQFRLNQWIPHHWRPAKRTRGGISTQSRLGSCQIDTRPSSNWLSAARSLWRKVSPRPLMPNPSATACAEPKKATR